MFCRKNFDCRRLLPCLNIEKEATFTFTFLRIEFFVHYYFSVRIVFLLLPEKRKVSSHWACQVDKTILFYKFTQAACAEVPCVLRSSILFSLRALHCLLAISEKLSNLELYSKFTFPISTRFIRQSGQIFFFCEFCVYFLEGNQY